MRSKPIVAAVVLFVLVIGGVWFAIYSLGAKETVAAFLPAPYTLTAPIVVHVTKTDSATTYSGEFPLMSQCGTISTGIAAIDTQTPHITLLFTVLEPSTGCPVPGSASQEFSASYIPNGQHVKPVFEGVTVNGIIAKYTLVENK